MLVLAGIVSAIPTGPNSVTRGTDQRRATQPSVAVDALAGNVSELTIYGQTITRYWQGFYGNISGTIVLANAQNQTLYEWNVADPQGEVYASRNATINWVNSIQCMTQTDISAEETFLGQNVTADEDSVNRTFNATNHPQFYVGSTNIAANSCYSTSVNNTGNGNIFYEVLLKTNSTNDTIYTSIIDQNTVGFDQKVHDFQMLVGDPGAGAETYPSGTVTTYYFYVELQ